MASQEIINIGALPNDGSGDPLRTAFSKINNNFSNLFNTAVATGINYTSGNTSNQLIFETPANTFTMGKIYIYTADSVTLQSQAIELFAQLNTSENDVKFTAYGTTFFGNALSSYDMAVSGGNVQVLATPLTENLIFHFIGSQNLWDGGNVAGVPLELDGYAANSVLSSEITQPIATEQS